MTSLQIQARALGDPTRHELFQYIAHAGRPVEVVELTEHVGLHHNAIRQHLAKLVEAGLLTEATSPSAGRGRPRLRYSVSAAVDCRWGVAGPYERLSLLLSEIIRTGDSPVDVGRRAGRRGRLGAAESADPVADLMETMGQHGFEPTVERHGDRIEISLGSCPFEATVLADPDTICQVHLGLAYGAAETVNGLVVDELVTGDPRRQQCRLKCHTEASP